MAVENPEMDCGLVVDGRRVRTIPMHRVRAGDQIVVGHGGVRVHAPSKQRGASVFEFMNSEVSSEKPKALVVQQVADRIRAAHAEGGKVLAVCGPAVVHTGGAPDVARLIEGGWIDVLFAGNGFATHDIESNVLGTSLGVLLAEGTLTEGGHSNHLRVINEVRRYGSIAAAVEAGYVTGGAMAACVRKGVPFVLGGSIRDDGPLPDVYTDTAAAADAMRELIPGVTVALMLASTLHAIAVGNCLPAGVETFCVDINQAVVTKLADRGSHQAHGIVTDVGPFLGQLADSCGSADGRREHERAARSWGRRYLMCPPHHFGVLYEINPWMHEEVAVEHERASQQWHDLVGQPAAGRRRGRHDGSAARGARPRVHRQRRHRERRAVRAEPLPPPGAPGRDGDRRRLVRRAGLPRSTGCPPSSTTRAPATRCRSRPRATTPCSCPATRSAATPPPSPRSARCSAARSRPCSWSTRGCTTSTSRSARSTSAARCARPPAGTPTAAR